MNFQFCLTLSLWDEHMRTLVRALFFTLKFLPDRIRFSMSVGVVRLGYLGLLSGRKFRIFSLSCSSAFEPMLTFYFNVFRLQRERAEKEKLVRQRRAEYLQNLSHGLPGPQFNDPR